MGTGPSDWLRTTQQWSDHSTPPESFMIGLYRRRGKRCGPDVARVVDVRPSRQATRRMLSARSMHLHRVSGSVPSCRVSREVAGFGIGDNRTLVAGDEEQAPDQFVDAQRFGSGNLDRAVLRRADHYLGDVGHDVSRRDGLQMSRRCVDGAVGGSRVGDSGDELEELGRSDDRVGGSGPL